MAAIKQIAKDRMAAAELRGRRLMRSRRKNGSAGMVVDPAATVNGLNVNLLIRSAKRFTGKLLITSCQPARQLGGAESTFRGSSY